MTTIALYSAQPVLTAGFQSLLAGLDDFSLSGVCTTLQELAEHLDTRRPGMLLLEVNSELTLQVLNNLKLQAGGASIVLLVDAVSTEFVSQILSIGVRGLVRKTMSLEEHIQCLRTVAAGELCIEKRMTDRLLLSKRVSLTQRERQLIGVISQGLKNKEIAYLLGISEGTVKVYMSRLFQKLGTNDRFELALFALKNMAATQTDAAETHAPRMVPNYLPSFVCIERSAALAG
jgi:two-component system nitrate/nitrite response regulator NarL